MKTKFLKKTISYILALTLFLVANCGLISLIKPTYVYGASNVSTSEVSITNSNFNSNTSSSYPFSPSSWTAARDEDNSGVTAGVINLEADDYKDIYSQNPLSDDAYVLMISSENSGTNFSYTMDSAVTLDASSNYMFTVDIYTTTNNGNANLYLIQDDEIYASLTNLSSINNWSTYYFFISTNDVDTVSVKLKLNAKGEGVVLFDNISCFKLNDNELKNRLDINTSLYTYVDESEANLIDTIDLSNDVFTNFSQGTGLTIVGLAYDTVSYDGSTYNAFKIENKTESYAKYQTSDDFLTVPQNRIYKLSIMVKTRNLSGNANLQLVQTGLEDDEEGVDSSILTITSDTSGEITNGYQEYSFYVFGYTQKSATFKLVVGLGDSDDETMTTGELYLTTAKITTVTYSVYSNASTGTTAEKVDLNATTTASTTYYLTNGTFDQFEITDYENPLPATPSSWSVTLGTGEQQYGVVNTSSEEFANLSNLDFTSLYNPDGSNGNENVLLMYNASADTLSYTSTSVSLSAGTYHRFSVNIQTQNSPVTLSLVSSPSDEEIVLSSIEVESSFTWKTVELYVYTGYSALDVSLKITLDSTSYAYCYVDNATFDYYGTPSASTFAALTNTNLRSVVDLSDLLSTNESKNWATPNFASGETVGNIKYGIINLNNADLAQEVVQDAEDLYNFTSLNSDNKNVIGIRALEDCYYTVTSLLGLNLTGGSYYKLTVSVFTKGIQIIDSSNVPEADEDGNIYYGAGFSLDAFDTVFENIISDGVWTTYTFYINPTDDTTTYLQFSLGSSSALVSGDVFFGGITLTETDETTFNSVTENSYTKVLTSSTTSSSDEDDSDSSDDSSSSVNWWYVIPSLVMVLALIVAVVGVALRKIKWKKPSKKTKNDYDRHRTVSKQIYKTKAVQMREEKLRELNAELKTLSSERVQHEENYKKDMNQLRELKIKRAEQSEINKLNKQLKKEQKLASSLGLTISRLESDIKYVKSDTYLNTLAKKLESEHKLEDNNTAVEPQTEPKTQKKNKQSNEKTKQTQKKSKQSEVGQENKKTTTKKSDKE